MGRGDVATHPCELPQGATRGSFAFAADLAVGSQLKDRAEWFTVAVGSLLGIGWLVWFGIAMHFLIYGYG